jgi:hypothetical protein
MQVQLAWALVQYVGVEARWHSGKRKSELMAKTFAL